MTSDDLLDRIWDDRRRLDTNDIKLPRSDDGDPFLRLLGKMRELHDAKGADYGDERGDNLHAAQDLGLSPYLGVLLRMNDKLTRLKVIARKGGTTCVTDEDVQTTLLDLAVYCLLAIMLHEEEHA
jgi:hypothetical protein